MIFVRLHKNAKAASEVDYPAYGVTGPAKERVGPGPGDRKLAQSAQMYHYQHQKQQMIAMEKWVLETNINIVDAYYKCIWFVQYFVEIDFSTSSGGFELMYFWSQPFFIHICMAFSNVLV